MYRRTITLILHVIYKHVHPFKCGPRDKIFTLLLKQKTMYFNGIQARLEYEPSYMPKIKSAILGVEMDLQNLMVEMVCANSGSLGIGPMRDEGLGHRTIFEALWSGSTRILGIF